MAEKWNVLSQIARWNALSKVSKFNVKIQLPEKYKGTIVEKWYKYWEGLLEDYSRVFDDIMEDVKAKPVKASFYGCAAVGGLVALYTNPDEVTYRNQLLQYQNDFGLVGKPVRNPSADVYLKSLNKAMNYGVIRRFSLGFFSIVWTDNYDPGLGIYKAQCQYLKPKLMNVYQRIIDVGFLNQYWIMNTKMKDYDVNPNEWIDFSKTEYGYRHRLPA